MKLLRFFLAAALYAGAGSWAMDAQIRLSAEQVKDVVRSSLALKHDDRKIADFLKKVQLTDRLTQDAVEDLTSQGAGPHTQKALEQLEAQSAKLAPAAGESAPRQGSRRPDQPASASMAPVGPPPPDSVEQQKMIDQAREYAMTYTGNLPNFLCVQVTRRYADFDGTDRWRLLDTITSQLSYNEGQEHYRLVTVNDRPTSGSLESLGGAVSRGEFGTMMREIFEAKSRADFQWDHWATLRGKLMAVFSFFIDSGHSDYSIEYERTQRIISAYRGKIYVDPNSGVISRITQQAVDIPAGFPVKQAETVLDYSDVSINGNSYFCPLKVTVRMAADRIRTRNDVEFRLYRKFGTESTISYDTPDALPDDVTKEQPAGNGSTNAGVPPAQPR